MFIYAIKRMILTSKRKCKRKKVNKSLTSRFSNNNCIYDLVIISYFCKIENRLLYLKKNLTE